VAFRQPATCEEEAHLTSQLKCEYKLSKWTQLRKRAWFVAEVFVMFWVGLVKQFPIPLGLAAFFTLAAAWLWSNRSDPQSVISSEDSVIILFAATACVIIVSLFIGVGIGIWQLVLPKLRRPIEFTIVTDGDGFQAILEDGVTLMTRWNAIKSASIYKGYIVMQSRGNRRTAWDRDAFASTDFEQLANVVKREVREVTDCRPKDQ
jgi:hypothetical protein